MKKFTVLFGFLILISSFTSIYAVDFQVEIEPGKTFTHPQDGLDYFMGNTSVYIDIRMGNNSGTDIVGYSQTLRFYSTNGDGTYIIWKNEGGTPEGSIVRMNGWEDATYWDVTNEINTFSWDGSLPDTMNHTTSSVIGWPDGDPTLTRLRFHFQVPVAGHDVTTDIVEICVDQSNTPDPTYDWMFPDESVFGGPYCFKFVGPSCRCTMPSIEGIPLSLATNHNVPFNLGPLAIYGSGFETYTGAGAIDENDDPIGTASLVGENFNWHFDPPCDWIDDGLGHTVRLYVETAVHQYSDVRLSNPISLIVTEGGAPEILKNYNSQILTDILETQEVNIELDLPGNDDEIWSYQVNQNPWGQVSFDNGHLSFMPKENDDGKNYTFTVRATDCMENYDECDITFYARSSVLCGDPNSDTDVNILDVVYLINGLYKNGPGPGPIEISDVNGDRAVNILDVVYVINYKYKGGSALNCPAWE